VNALSEPDAPFFSDNYVSNETSYLQVKLPPRGGAYIGVGPEQNFAYIAMLRPKVAFIVDIRRGNRILHLLYKAIFEKATSRSHFLTLLLGRPHEEGPGTDVLADAQKLPPDEKTYAAVHADLVKTIEGWFPLNADDRASLERIHRAFFRAQLDLRFELKEKNGRNYPPLRELLANPAGFLATEDAFRFVQTMQKEHAILPVVGDFAGDRAMPAVAAAIRARGLTVSAFYVSNVEQYLFEGQRTAVWSAWARNVAALPVDDASVFVRAYLDQGRPHPRQQKGHRTATVLQKIADFKRRQAQKPYVSFFEVATDQLLD
jgi:hypothetical protein